MHIKNPAIGMLASVLLVVDACSGQKNVATQAVSAAETALKAIQEDAAKYLPSELESVESALTAQKESLARGDYKVVVANASALNSSIESLTTGVARKIEENTAAAAEWGSYATAVPQMVTVLQSRVDTLVKSRRTPKGLDAKAFGTVQTDLESMKVEWAAASAANDSGNSIEAVARARSARATGEKLLAQLGISTG